MLFVDWCRAQQATAPQRELILDPLCRLWAIRELETITGYVETLAGAGFRVRSVGDLSAPTAFNWDQVALLSKAAADAGVLRYVSFLAVRD